MELASNSAVQVVSSQGVYEEGVWDVGALAAGAAATLELTAVVAAGTDGQVVTNVAAVTASDQGDPNQANNTGSVTLLVTVAGLEDTDGDGMPDYWEERYCGGPTNCVAGADDDGDGADNISEWVADTIPTNALSVFIIEDMALGGSFEISFDSSTGRLYSLQQVLDLVNGTWTNVPGDVDRPGVGGTFVFTNESATVLREYRIGVRLPPPE
jgi:hypothetical protein